jgi:hypothetical protein
MNEDPRYDVRNKEIETLLKDLGRLLHNRMPEGWGFTLTIFSFGPGGDLFYISDAKRDDMIRTMREFIAKQGKQ